MDEIAAGRFASALHAATAAWSLEIPPEKLDLLRRHFDAVLETNKGMNLTRITDPVEAAVRHYADSLVVLNWVCERGFPVKTVLDVGTGAGFPALPIAVFRPEWAVSAIDSTRKKADFVQKTAKMLGLTHVQVHHARAEEWRPRRRFDLVVLRAVAPMADGIMAVSHLVSPSGRIVLFKSTRVSETELKSAFRAADRLKLTPEPPFEYVLRGEKDDFAGRLFLFCKI
jgi:16S rRNA (guanine527-N7)-methyltransferase